MQHLSSKQHTAGHLFQVGTIFELGLGLLALGLAWLMEVELFPGLFPLRAEPFLQGGIAAGGMIAAAWLLAQRRWEPLEEIFRQIVRLLGPLLLHGRWWQWAVLSLAAGWGEELLFRGVLQTKLQQHLGLWPAVVVASVVFGGLHAITPLYFLLATIIGFAFGWLFYYTGSLVSVSLAHALYDFWALAYLSHRYRQEIEVRGEAAPQEEQGE